MQVFDNLVQKVDDDPASVKQLYDDWAEGYNANLTAWGYDAPQVGVSYLTGHVDPGAPVLDAGCGTGLVGQHLRAAGFSSVTGIDFSDDSLQLAQASGVYQAVQSVDLTALPTALPSNHFAAVICIGVMSYLPDVEATCREFCRLARAGATIILSQRSDLFEARQTQAAFDAVTAAGLWQPIEVTGDRPYLPGNPEFEGTFVRYGAFQRL